MFPALAAAGVGALTLAAPAPSMAADSPATPSTTGDHAKSTIVGSLQHTPIEFWCSKGMPNHVIAVGTVKTPEATVTVSEPQLHETHTMGPVTHDKPLVIFSKINQAGKTVTITVKGNTSGSAFSVTGTIPATCKGLPTVQPNGTVTPPAQPTKPMPGTPTPTKPAPKPIGPQVQTHLVAAQGSSTSGEIGLAGLAFAAIAAGGVVTSRHR